jgi:glutathione peroxidase-family protein
MNPSDYHIIMEKHVGFNFRWFIVDKAGEVIESVESEDLEEGFLITTKLFSKRMVELGKYLSEEG